jgi:predicted ArsR family transcriptional regulator
MANRPFRDIAKRGESTIITVDQLPDSRRAILLALKREGPSTIAYLAAELQLTGEAVRQQLLQLQREGWIEAKIAREQERGRTGRPATRYNLTEAGDHLFPKNYDLLNVAMLDAVVSELGPDAATRVLERVADERVNAAEAQVRGRSLAERVEALKSLYFESDPYMQVETAPDGFYLVERNCPFYNTAMRRPILCNVSVNALTRLLGVRVERDERFQHGDGRCVFHVHADQPIDPAAWQFQLEE